MPLEKYDRAWCMRIITHLMKWTLTAPFRQPVDPVHDGAENYYTIVKEPIDLSTIKKKLNENKYDTIEEFTNDIHKIYTNCVLFNGEGSMLSYIASDMNTWFNKQLELKSTSSEEEWKIKVSKLVEKMAEHMKLNPSERMSPIDIEA